MSKNDEWFSPDKLLEASQKAELSSPTSLDDKNDFGSYAKASRGGGVAGSGIESHNLIQPYERVLIYRHILAHTTKRITSIADVGCGLGYTTAMLAEVFATQDVTGYEVSKDACDFAARQWPSLSFIAQPVYPNTCLKDKYDLILAQEFYPFTRTADYSTHLSYVRSLTGSLKPGGVVLISLTEGTPESVLQNLQQIKETIASDGWRVTIVKMPFERVLRHLRHYQIARLISTILRVVLNKKPMAAILIRQVNP